jgi:hypothetical protein
MPSSLSQFLRMPGEQAHEHWTSNGSGGWKAVEAERSVSGCIVAIEALATDSAPFWMADSPDGAIDPAEMVGLHWEAMGLDTALPGRNWCHWRAGEESGRVLTATMALAAEVSQDEWISLLPVAFEPSARLLPIPAGECAVWRELGRAVVAFNRGKHLLHVAVLNSRTLDKEAAREICDLVRALEARGLLEDFKGFRIWTSADAAFTESLEKLLGVAVKAEAKPAPRLPEVPSALLLSGVEKEREDLARRSQQMRLIATIGLACIAFFGAWVGWLWAREQRVERNLAQLSAQEPEVQAVRNAQLKWAALEPAVEPQLYPVEVFYQVVALLPPEGIQLQEFAFDPDKLVISGVATTASYALKFKDAIEHCEPLQRYAWNFPQPSIKEDNRAIFRAEGLLAGGAQHEGE